MKNFPTNWVYILASQKNGTLYVGSTRELALRLEEHRSGRGSAFVWKYKVFKLVYFEGASGKNEALHREHQLKRWLREWKIQLIETTNPDWRDLTEEASAAAAQEF